VRFELASGLWGGAAAESERACDHDGEHAASYRRRLI
jgi:hypothetical protein